MAGVTVIFEAGAGAALRAGGSLAEKEAQAVVDDTCAAMGLPFCPAVSVDCITPGCLRDSTINSAVGYAETELSAVVGFPVHLPRKLTLEEFENAIGAIIPTNFWGAVDLAVTAASQALAAGVTSLLAGAGLGSVVPGLGTIVGIGVALGVGVAKDLLKEKPEPYQKLCKDPWTCPPVTDAAPLWILSTALNEYARTAKVLAAHQAKEYCRRPELQDCMRRWAKIIEYVAASSVDTAEMMTGAEVSAVLPSLERAPKSYDLFKTDTRKIVSEPFAEGRFSKVPAVIAQLRARQAKLLQLGADLARLDTLDFTPTRNLQMALLGEIDAHAVALQNSQGSPLFKANAVALARVNVGLQAASARLLAISPAQKAVKTVAAMYKGVTLHAKYAPRSTALLAPRLTACARLYDAWAKDHPREAACVDASTKNALIGLCLRASLGTISPETMFAQADALIAVACRRAQMGSLWAAFTGGFRDSPNPFTLRERANLVREV